MQILYHNNDVGGEVVRDDDNYVVRDNHTLNNLVLSSTCLRRGRQTRGHRHPGQEEIYFFVQGHGKMIVGDENSQPFAVCHGSVVLIPDGAFHRVINDGDANLVFNCVFQGKRNH